MEEVIKYLTQVTVLYRRTKVPINENEQFMKPTQSIIRDTLYTQYIELYHNHITKWNQQRKEKVDVPASLKKERIVENKTSSPWKHK
ncbi:hypothetical protein J1N35_019018, partial [Gossypium stocksii]